MAAGVSLGLRNLPRPCHLWISGSFRGCLRAGLQASRRLTTLPVTRPRLAVLSNNPSINSVSFIRESRLPFWHQLYVVQPFSSSSAGDEGEEGGEEKPADEQESDGDESLGLLAPIVKQFAVAPVSIPERFPEVPVLPISRNPIFPRFVKMLEVWMHAEVHFMNFYNTCCNYGEKFPLILLHLLELNTRSPGSSPVVY